MNYEKKYKEALATAKAWCDCEHATTDDKILLKRIFSELRESEDERIRKFIKDVLDSYGRSIKCPTKDILLYEKSVAWLENQGMSAKYHDLCDTCVRQHTCQSDCFLQPSEQKPADKVEPKFHEGEWVVWQGKCYKVNYNGCGYELVDQDGLSTSLEYGTIDENAHIWDISKDAKDGDVLFQDLMCGKTFIYNGVNPDMAILYSFIISNDGKDVLPYHIGKTNTGIGNIEENKNIIHPATKEQRDLLFQKMHEAGYEWDAEKKELKKIEQKPTEDVNLPVFDGYLCLMLQKFRTKGMCTNSEIIDYVKEHSQKLRDILVKSAWSEEDEKNFKKAIKVLKVTNFHHMADMLQEMKYKLIPMEETNNWKPSEEQMKMLNEVLNFAANHESLHWNDYIFGTLNNLIRQLKKLKD